MKIIKRSGMEDTFDIKKIEAAIRKANESVIDYEKLTEEKIQEILANVEKACENMKRSPSVEEIQDMVENQIMNSVHSMWHVIISLIVIRELWSVNLTLPMNRS